MAPTDPLSLEKNIFQNTVSPWLAASTLSLLVGQAVAASWTAPKSFLILLALPVLVLVSMRRKKWALLGLIAVAAFALGYARHAQVLRPKLPPNHLRSVLNDRSEIYVEGVLQQEPQRVGQQSRWIFRAERIWHPTGAEEVTGLVQITVRYPRREWHFGDRIRLQLRPSLPRQNANPGGFDYISFQARRGIHLTGFLENDDGVELVGRRGSALWVGIQQLRREIRKFFETRLSQENAALMKALVIGDRGGVSKEMRDDFAAAGVAHLLAISGLHIGMFAGVVFFLVRCVVSMSTTILLRFSLLKIAALLSLLAVLFYTALAGAMIPAMRAAIMIGVYVLAVLLDREEEILSSLCLAALIIGLYWPGAIMEISFQLSFAAVLFIVLGLRIVQRIWRSDNTSRLPAERRWWEPRMRQMALYLAVPALATLGTGPLIAYHFGYLSLGGFLANPTVVPLVGFVVVPIGLLTGFFSLVGPGVAETILTLLSPLASVSLGLIRWFAALSWAKISVPVPNLAELLLLYALILSAFVMRRRQVLVFFVAFFVLASCGSGFYWWKERWNRKELRVTFLSVGHGDAAVVEFPGSKALLIDAGGVSSGDFDTGESIVAPFLRSRKILKVDYLLVSHPRVDHYAGMRTIIKEFSPSEFWAGPSRGRSARYDELEEALESARIKRVTVDDREPCREIERVRLCVLYPSAGKTGDVSVVVRLTFGQASLLFPGDIEKRDEKVLLQKASELSSAVVKVPRHGSLTSSTEEFVGAVKPKLAIFSVGERSRFGLPRDEVVGRYEAVGAEILRTDQDGAIIIETDGKTVRYRTYRTGRRGILSNG